MDVLNEFELQEFEDQKEEIKQKFEITDLDSLNWAFRKLKAYKEKEREITELAEAERERINRWEEQEKDKIKDSVSFFETLINEYHAKVLQQDPKQKTLSTPYGKSKTRRMKSQVKKANEKSILEHVVNNGMDEYIKPTLKWSDFKKSIQIAEINGEFKAIDENGQEVPGTVIEPEQIKFSVEVE